MPIVAGWATALLVSGALAVAARADVSPFLDCVRNLSSSNELLVDFGYVNTTSAPVDIPDGDFNFFSPGPSFRGQPTSLLPGSHPYAFRTKFLITSQMPDLSWLLGTGVATAEPSSPTCTPLFWAGPWQANAPYLVNDVVFHNGGSWVAAEDPGNSQPGVGSAWQSLAAAGAIGPQGPAGPQGPRGATGAQGPTGDAGRSGATASRIIGRFDRRGRVTVADPAVTSRSVIVIQYSEPSRAVRRPSNVKSVGAGTFTATGAPRAHFRYVVYQP